MMLTLFSFFSTLGYSDHGYLIKSMMDGTPKDAITVKEDRRGRAPDPRRVDKDLIRAHIRSVPGGISHYR